MFLQSLRSYKRPNWDLYVESLELWVQKVNKTVKLADLLSLKDTFLKNKNQFISSYQLLKVSERSEDKLFYLDTFCVRKQKKSLIESGKLKSELAYFQEIKNAFVLLNHYACSELLWQGFTNLREEEYLILSESLENQFCPYPLQDLLQSFLPRWQYSSLKERFLKNLYSSQINLSNLYSSFKKENIFVANSSKDFTFAQFLEQFSHKISEIKWLNREISTFEQVCARPSFLTGIIEAGKDFSSSASDLDQIKKWLSYLCAKLRKWHKLTEQSPFFLKQNEVEDIAFFHNLSSSILNSILTRIEVKKKEADESILRNVKNLKQKINFNSYLEEIINLQKEEKQAFFHHLDLNWANRLDELLKKQQIDLSLTELAQKELLYLNQDDTIKLLDFSLHCQILFLPEDKLSILELLATLLQATFNIDQALKAEQEDYSPPKLPEFTFYQDFLLKFFALKFLVKEKIQPDFSSEYWLLFDLLLLLIKNTQICLFISQSFQLKNIQISDLQKLWLTGWQKAFPNLVFSKSIFAYFKLNATDFRKILQQPEYYYRQLQVVWLILDFFLDYYPDFYGNTAIENKEFSEIINLLNNFYQTKSKIYFTSEMSLTDKDCLGQSVVVVEKPSYNEADLRLFFQKRIKKLAYYIAYQLGL